MASSSFGTAGSAWIMGVGIGFSEVVWYAVAIDYGVEATLLGLATSGVISTDVLSGWELGPLSLRSPVFLLTAAFWIFITGTASLLRLTAVIAALMKVYAPVALLLLTGAGCWGLLGLGGSDVSRAVSIAKHAGSVEAGTRISCMMLFTGFFALPALSSLDWGAASEKRRDLTLGGLVGIVMAGAWTAIMSLLVVGGAIGRYHGDGKIWPVHQTSPPLFSFRWGIVHGMAAYPAAAVLVLFGLAALAPACYSTWGYSVRFVSQFPKLRRYQVTWIGGAISLIMIALSWSSRLETVDRLMGLFIAPILGALVGDSLHQHGGWSGVRPGINPLGMIAWLGGFVSQLLGEIVASRTPGLFADLLSSSSFGFVIAAGVYWLLAYFGMAPPTIAIEASGSRGMQPENLP